MPRRFMMCGWLGLMLLVPYLEGGAVLQRSWLHRDPYRLLMNFLNLSGPPTTQVIKLLPQLGNLFLQPDILLSKIVKQRITPLRPLML